MSRPGLRMPRMWTGLNAALVLLFLMVVAAGCGGGSSGSKNAPPEAVFSVSANSGFAPLSVTFDASSSSDSDGTITGYAWTFDDGATGIGSSIQHIYRAAGTYTAKLTITDSGGLTDTLSLQIAVTASPPRADFTVSADGGVAPLSVVFDASGSSDNDGTIDSYAWTFGDGTTGSGSDVEHTYPTAGDYSAVLTVTDNDGLTDTESHEIAVTNPVPQSYTISGTVTSADHVAADSDVNDVNTAPAPNNSFAYAQVITAPVSVSGYVNVASSGEPGNSFFKGDTEDYYRVFLIRGMNIMLYMVEAPGISELNLYLYDNQQHLVPGGATVTDDNGVAALEAPESGTYFVRVEAAEYLQIHTATVYALTLGLANLTATQHPLRLGNDFVPGEVLVRFREEMPGAAATSAFGPAAESAMGFSAKAGASGRERLLKRSTSVEKGIFFERLGVKHALLRSISPGKMDSRTRAKMETLWMIRAMRRQPGVLFAEPNYIRRPLLVPNDPYYSYQWHYPLIHLPEAWDITTGSNDVVVAVVDSGVLLSHPDLLGQLVGGYDFISDPDISLDGDGIDINPDDPGDQEGGDGGSSFHGTHVAGTVGAASNNGKGGAGAAWNAGIMPLRVLGKGGGTSWDIMQAVRYAAGLDNDSGMILANPVDIINLSLGGGGYSQIEADLVAAVRQQGVVMIASAGNEGSSAPMYPASYDGVVSVSAVTISEALAPYSNFGAAIDVAAPGGSSTDTNGDGRMDGVLSTMGDDSGGTIEMNYAFSTGTSMAAPHVSGVAALMRSIYPGLTPEEFDTLLAGGYLTRDIGDPGRDDQFGNGLIDAYKAVVIAKEGGVNGELPPLLTVSPGILNFGTSLNEGFVMVVNGGGGAPGSLFVTKYSSNTPWLSVTASGDVDVLTGLGTYIVSVNRDGLAAGTTNTGIVTFVSNKNRVDISVVVQKRAETGSTDGGYHYVLLLDSDTYDPKGQVHGAGEDGVYDFSFSGLPYGETYVIFAGTDPNNDGFICDDGEACGAYISLDKPVALTVTNNISGLDFTTDLNISLPDASSSRFAGAGLPLQRDVLKEIAK